MRYLLYLLPLIGCLGGCASTYKPINPKSAYYTSVSGSEKIEFSYRHGVLRDMGNKKYAKREDRKAIRLASVKIYNGSDAPLTVGKDLVINVGNAEAVLLEPTMLHRELKQG